MTPTFSIHGNLAPLCCLHYFRRVYTMIGLGSDKKTSDYSSGHQVLARVAIFIYVVLAPGSMWATWQAASTGKSTPSPPSNAQASIFSYFSHTHPPRACSTYLSLLVLKVHWLWVWAQVEGILLSHLMLVRAFFVLPLRPYILTSWKCWRFWEVKMFSLWAEFAQSRETSSGWTSDNSSANHSVNKPCLGSSAQVKTTCSF